MPSLDPVYIIGAVAVIALLVLVLVLVLRGVRARRDRAPAPPGPAVAEPESGWASGPETWPADEEPSATAAWPAGGAEPAIDAGPIAEAQPVVGAEHAGYAGPADDAYPATEARPAVAATGAKPRATPMFETDPVMVLVKSLLQNSGELDPAEFRRLELYRPQRIIDAVDTLTPKMTGRSNESKRSRLQRIRQYAVSLKGEFESEEEDLVPKGVVPAGASAVQPGAIGALPPAEMAHVLPPEDWGSAVGGSELALDTELSVLHDDPSPVPETEESPAPEAEESQAPETEESQAPSPVRGADDLSSMSPREIGDALALSDEIDFKKAAIDALEQVGTPEALSQLQHCLEDPDPEVQVYALSAAERLLGP